MIVETPDGAAIEIFWQRRGSKPWSQVAALRFLSSYRPTREGLRGLRWLLCDRADSGTIWQSTDQQILERTAQLMVREALIVARYGAGNRWPGSGFVLGSGPESSILFWRDRLRCNDDLYQIRKSLQRLKAEVLAATAPAKPGETAKKKTPQEQEQIAANQRYVGALRRVVHSAPGMPNFDLYRDDLFLDHLLGFFESGELIAIFHRNPGRFQEQKNEKPVEALPVRPQTERPEIEDPSTFDPAHNAGQQGGVLADAADDGIPFLEICQAPRREARR